jgi:uncharacterized protein (TIGR00369 family)
MTRQTWFAPPPGAPNDAWLEWANRLPLSKDLGMTCTEIGDGRATFQIAEVPLTPNPNGGINGGLVAAAIHQVMGAIGMLSAPPGHAIATATLSVQYLRPAHPPLTFLGAATKRGRTLVFIDVAVEDAEGQLTTSATGTMMIVPYGESQAEPSVHAA